MTSGSAPNLLEAVLEILRASTVPLRAADIASRLGAESDLSAVRGDVNRALYGPLQSFVAKDEQSRWILVRDPTLSRSRASRSQRAEPPSSQVPSLPPMVAERVGRQLEEWKKSLIDFGKSNKLLYFNSARRTRLHLTRPEPEVLYEGLILRDKSFSFATPAGGNIDLIELEDERDESELPERRGDIVVDYMTSSAKDVVSLQKKLYRLRSDARSTLNEQGINTLHVGIGVLRWHESSNSEESIESPLILIPAAIDREKNGPYKLTSFEGDVVINPTLVHRLRHDFDLELPSFDPFDGFGEEADPMGYLETLTGLVARRGWSVSDDVWLTHFSFEKLVMFEDLSQPGTPEAIAEHDVLAALTGVREIEDPGISIEEALPSYELPEAYPVVDADSSQLEVLARARAKSSMVVQGPPGTGKSQTIVNLIAQAIRDGRSVLFVSEKRAALDVVYRRLRDAGLADLCLELHSHKANKREVVSDLYLALDASNETRPAADRALFEERRALRLRLDEYVAALHRPRGEGSRTGYEVHGELARLDAAPVVTSDLPVDVYADLSREDRAVMTQALDAIARTGVWGREDSHPWRDFDVRDPAFAARQEIMPQVVSLQHALRLLIEARRSLEVLFGASLGPNEVNDGMIIDTLLQRIDGLPEVIESTWLTLPRSEFETGLEIAGHARERVNQAAEMVQALEGVGATALIQDPALVAELLPRYKEGYQKRRTRLSGDYRRDRRRLRALCGKARYAVATTALKDASEWIKVDAWLQSTRDELQRFVGRSWPAEPTDSDQLHDALRRVASIRECLPPEGLVAPTAQDIAQRLLEVKEEARGLRSVLKASVTEAESALSELQRWLPNGIHGRELGVVPLDELDARVSGWIASQDLLLEWTAFGIEERNCAELGLSAFLTEARKANVPSGGLSHALERLVDMRWVAEVYRGDPALGAFAAKNHRATIETFCRLDKELLNEARQAVQHAASEGQKDVRVAARYAVVGAGRAPEEVRAARDECRRISKEYLKKSKHLPLRRLLPDLPNILPSIKPCLLMSPLSVASYLPRDRFRFDVVIFDEASQVHPADAIGAILRAEQVIVLGDSKQLPPTDFFRKRLDDGDDDVLQSDEADEETPTFASILEACATALPEQPLRWHYRSRDERLIAFSNRTFYKERPLITFPSPDLGSDNTGVHFDYVENGLYDRGGSRTNIVEARHVVGRILEHFDVHGWDRSLGVITLGIAQRDVIELELRRRLIERPELAPFLAEQGSEPFFIKNLETVQGDERDDIILSLGFGPSEPGGKPALAFGPVGAKGGERRLNVAVTRAKYSMTLVSSMRPEHLDRTALLANEGPKVLSSYVRYAARGGRFDDAATVDPTRQPESDFEMAVRNALVDLGYLVDSQVGVSHFRLDLAVADSAAPTRYLLGIECDGATYHRAASARDRDRLRQEVLEEQGWHIYRIWSTDWIQHPAHALDALVHEIERVRLLRQPAPVRELVAQAQVQLPPPPSEFEFETVPPAPSVQIELPAPFLEEQRQSLAFELTRLERQVRTLNEELTDIKGQPDKGYAGDVIEHALGQRLLQVRAALEAIETGRYGICTRCGGEIEIERLEAVPSASVCRNCSQLDR